MSEASGDVRIDIGDRNMNIISIVSNNIAKEFLGNGGHLSGDDVTLENVQKYLLMSIGWSFKQRCRRLKRKLLEVTKACDLLLLAVLKTLRQSVDLAVEKKRGISDIDLLCKEFEKDDKLKENKREQKKTKKALKKKIKKPIQNNSSNIDDSVDEFVSEKVDIHGQETIKAKAISEDFRTLAEMLENGFEDQDEEYSIPEEDIKNYFQNRDEIVLQRQLLRETLKQNFADYCNSINTRWSCYRVKLEQRENCQEFQLSGVLEFYR